jgi:hypothetical protein
MQWAHLVVLKSEHTDAESYPEDIERPITRADCPAGGSNAARPCPFVSCRHHLYLETPTPYAVQLNYPTREPWELEKSCALDVAEGGELELTDIATLFDVSKQAISFIAVRATRKLRGRLRELEENARPKVEPKSLCAHCQRPFISRGPHHLFCKRLCQRQAKKVAGS